MQAVILAAGRGTRLWPLTASTPKPLLPVGDRSLLAHVAETAVAAGASELVVVASPARRAQPATATADGGAAPSQRDHPAGPPDHDDRLRAALGDAIGGVPVRYVEQDPPRGTADALWCARGHLDGQFAVLNGDNLYDVPSLEGLFAAGPAVGVHPVEEPSCYGVVELEDGRVVEIVEKPDDPPSRLANAGAYVFPAAAAEHLDVERSERGEYELTDVLGRVLETHEVTAVEVERWIDVGRPWELLAATERVLSDGVPRPDGTGERTGGANRTRATNRTGASSESHTGADSATDAPADAPPDAPADASGTARDDGVGTETDGALARGDGDGHRAVRYGGDAVVTGPPSANERFPDPQSRSTADSQRSDGSQRVDVSRRTADRTGDRSDGDDAPGVAGSVHESAVLSGDVVVEAGATVEPGTVIEGPVLVREGATVGPNAYVRGATVLGPDVRVGNAVEVKNSVLLRDATVGHLSYVGDSVLCPDVNLGAGTVVANLRHDESPVALTVKGERVSTGRRKFGAVFGGGVKTGINTSVAPGVTLSPGARTRPGEVVTRDR